MRCIAISRCSRVCDGSKPMM
uniref:Uncharacterized protein n=1 Tax=Anguilla anguilla TaxID=7936 RepID=A0A0E9XXV1_ANGAN